MIARPARATVVYEMSGPGASSSAGSFCGCDAFLVRVATIAAWKVALLRGYAETPDTEGRQQKPLAKDRCRKVCSHRAR